MGRNRNFLFKLILVLGWRNVFGAFNMTEYYKMPLLHRTEDVGRCLFSTEDDNNLLCVVFTLIKPDNTSELWNQIEVFSNDLKKHFRHDFIHAGICLKTCEQQLSELTEFERDELFVEEFPWKIGRKWYDDGTTPFKNTLKYRELYGRKMNQCVNLWLQTNYNLSGASKIHFCNSNRDAQEVEYDHWHYTFISVTFTILFIVLFASIWDAKRNINSHLSHYKNDVKDLTLDKRCLLCFSLIRNWFRLTDKPKTELGKDIRYIQAVRYIATFIFVLAHQMLAYSLTPSLNPEFVESTYHSSESVSLHNTNTVQTFFQISGFLLYISIHEIFKKHEFNLKYFWIAILYRYIRLTPLLAYFVLFDATFLYDAGVGSGGYWKFFTEAEKTFCRRNWWTNLLHINNYVNVDQMCMIHSWYIAADTQLFIFTLVLLMIMWKYPKIKHWLFGIVFTMSCVIQFVVNYVNGYDGIFLMTAETKRTLYYSMQEEFKYDFITAHTNLSNYLQGIAVGMLYFYIKRRKIELGKYKSFLILWYLNFPFGHLILSAGAYIFYNYNFEKSIWLSLVSVFMKNIWGVSGIILFLGFLSKFESGAKRFLNWHVFTSLGRLTYGIYVSHLTVARFMFGRYKNLASFSYADLFIQTIGLFAIVNLLAVILCLCIEFPMTALAKILLRSQQKRKADIEENGKAIEMEVTTEREKFVLNKD